MTSTKKVKRCDIVWNKFEVEKKDGGQGVLQLGRDL